MLMLVVACNADNSAELITEFSVGILMKSVPADTDYDY